ncbi:MAG: replication factor C large subunit [Candidatus Heimdallarchaeota archaeon]|nr:replication factor C large subunit [Candidatus Heimdallarchaeota archaeon]
MASQTNTLAIPWVEKYRPEYLIDFVGNRDSVLVLEEWLKTWNQQKKKVALLAGPAGVGKTSVVHYLIKKYKYEFVEVNASDNRNKKSVELLVGKSSTEGTVLQGAKVRKLILVDEADGLFGNEDRGGGSALGKAVTLTRIPIICTANDPSAKSLKSAKRSMKVIEFHRLKEDEILHLLKKIADKEGVKINETTLIAIAKNCGGDARSAINDLEGAAFGSYDKEIIFAPRNQQHSLDDALNNIFKVNNFKDVKSALDGVDVDYRELLTYVYEHAWKQSETSTEQFNMYELIAVADFYLSKCYIKQDWKFLKYFFTFISSVGLVKSSSFKSTKYGFPSYWSLMARLRGKNAKIKSLAEKSTKKLHCSKKVFQSEYYPYIRIIFNTDTKMAGGLAAWFQYNDDDLDFLTEGSSKLIKRIKEQAEEAYVHMAGDWIEKAKSTEKSLLFYNDLTERKKPKTSTPKKPKKPVEKQEQAEEASTDKKTEKEDSSEEDVSEKKKDSKKEAQTSLESFIN